MKMAYSYIMDYMLKKLSGWKSRTSLLGQITLVNSFLTSISNYTMQSVLLPKGLYEEIDSIVTGFLSGYSDSG